ncbi:MAG: hypothetical protein M1818_004232 [Claussenomyces sp. TS43310]|nr:MAG: hypothetical protein M1818_004232 [Claussenomyces sp. TS43310]
MEAQPLVNEDERTRPLNSLPHDSMVTVRLSEPLSLKTVSRLQEATDFQEDTTAAEADVAPTRMPQQEIPSGESSRASALSNAPHTPADPYLDTSEISSPGPMETRRSSKSSVDSEGGQVNWEELEKTEELEPRDQDSEDSTALLLARLEQENNLLVTNPKSGLTQVTGTEPSENRQSRSRPPSMQQLKKMVNNPTPSALRYSLIPAPPMTDLEFYAALVQDYKRTAQRLPTLLSKKIRSGIPPPLRGVVWQSMSGARDRLLEDEFDRLCGESSSFEGIIAKDLGRSFPGVEMFRDSDGDGQRMLGRVLKCFSLYDLKIGYCQGLGFLVGPLLMHMGDKQAFCVLVRLMENYDLRSCFLPDLSGLHVRIYQFRELLRKHLPALNAHLDALQIEPAYVSQWFLSFFAVTCPLPMLFRIYDVIFAEGASETIMRVALAVMRRNEEKIVACTEFEDVMQLLLSRGLWDCYHYDADNFVEDFVSLTSIVTNESLRALELSFKESRGSDSAVSPSSDVGSAAARFLGRLWAGSTSVTKSATLSPNLAGPSRPSSFLRRSPSKQSIASTLNSVEGGTDSILSSASTEATTVSRDSSNTDSSSIRQSTAFSSSVTPSQKASANSQNDLHGQIEDLLMALSELQRDHAILATQLQREREEREEDHTAVRSLLNGLKKKNSSETVKCSVSEESLATVKVSDGDEMEVEKNDAIDVSEADQQFDTPIEASEDYLARLLDVVQERISIKLDQRRSSMMQSRSQLREELARSKEHLIIEVSKSQDFNRRLSDAERELANLRDQVKEGHNHIRNAHSEKQRLEKQVQELRSRKAPAANPDLSVSVDSERPSRASTHGGLRELKLGRANSTRSVAPSFTKRTSSLGAQNVSGKENDSPDSETASPNVDNDTLILELVQAKTAEATAKQEAEEAKAKLESLRRLLSGNVCASDSPSAKSAPGQYNLERSATMGPSASNMTSRSNDTKASLTSAATASTAAGGPSSIIGGGFWTGWGKRSVSTGPMPSQERA